jgi:hypothetical protein
MLLNTACTWMNLYFNTLCLLQLVLVNLGILGRFEYCTLFFHAELTQVFISQDILILNKRFIFYYLRDLSILNKGLYFIICVVVSVYFLVVVSSASCLCAVSIVCMAAPCRTPLYFQTRIVSTLRLVGG